MKTLADRERVRPDPKDLGEAGGTRLVGLGVGANIVVPYRIPGK